MNLKRVSWICSQPFRGTGFSREGWKPSTRSPGDWAPLVPRGLSDWCLKERLTAGLCWCRRWYVFFLTRGSCRCHLSCCWSRRDWDDLWWYKCSSGAYETQKCRFLVWMTRRHQHGDGSHSCSYGLVDSFTETSTHLGIVLYICDTQEIYDIYIEIVIRVVKIFAVISTTL